VLVMAEPKSKVTSIWNDGVRASIAIRDEGYIPILDDGRPATVNLFEGGYLVQGAPLNAWIDGYWYTGQKAIIAPFIQSGQVPQPPQAIWNLPEVEPPPDVLQNYATAKGVPGATSLTDAYQRGGPISGGAGGMDWTTLAMIGAGAVLLFFVLPSRRKSAGAASGSTTEAI
jgi:hypothetical protein